MSARPTLSISSLLPAAQEAVDGLIASLQAGWDASEPDLFDSPFAADIAWGSPFGQTISGYQPLNNVHKMIMSKGKLPESKYEVVGTLAPAPGVVVCHVRRRNLGEVAKGGPGGGEGRFDEMAMYVLIEREGRWWLCAGQNTVVGEAPKRA